MGGPVILPQWERSWGQFLGVSNTFLLRPIGAREGGGQRVAISHAQHVTVFIAAFVLSFCSRVFSFLNEISFLTVSHLDDNYFPEISCLIPISSVDQH